MSSHPFLHGCAVLTLAAELENAQNGTTGTSPIPGVVFQW